MQKRKEDRIFLNIIFIMYFFCASDSDDHMLYLLLLYVLCDK